MASGLPVLVTQVGANREIVREGIEGYLVPPSNWEAMAAKLEVAVMFTAPSQ